MAGKQQQPKQQTMNNEPLDVRMIQEKVRSDAEVIEVKMNAHEKRMEELAKKSEEATKFLGAEMKLGVAVGLVILFVALYGTLSPLVKEVVDKASNKIDWDARMKVAADEQLKAKVTKDLLANVINNDEIQKAATAVADLPAFKSEIRKVAEAAARKAVTANVDKIIADTNNFRAVIDEQLRVEKDRLQAATATIVPISADNRNELKEKLYDTVMSYKKLGLGSMYIQFYPIDNDVIHFTAGLQWRPEEPPKRRVIINTLVIEKINLTRDDLRERIAKYFDQPAVPEQIEVRRNSDPSRKKFTPGEFEGREMSLHADYESAAGDLAINVIDLADECFGVKYPATWRVQLPH